jgi:hypothetical protein
VHGREARVVLGRAAATIACTNPVTLATAVLRPPAWLPLQAGPRDQLRPNTDESKVPPVARRAPIRAGSDLRLLPSRTRAIRTLHDVLSSGTWPALGAWRCQAGLTVVRASAAERVFPAWVTLRHRLSVTPTAVARRRTISGPGDPSATPARQHNTQTRLVFPMQRFLVQGGMRRRAKDDRRQGTELLLGLRFLFADMFSSTRFRAAVIVVGDD